MNFADAAATGSDQSAKALRALEDKHASKPGPGMPWLEVSHMVASGRATLHPSLNAVYTPDGVLWTHDKATNRYVAEEAKA